MQNGEICWIKDKYKNWIEFDQILKSYAYKEKPNIRFCNFIIWYLDKKLKLGKSETKKFWNQLLSSLNCR